MFGAVHHAGFIVRAFEPAERHFAALGYRRLAEPVDDPGYDAEIVFLARGGAAPGEPLVELIRPKSPASALHGHTERNELQIHHLCFAVEDINAALQSLRSARMAPVGHVRPAPAIGGRAICFFFSSAVGLFELVEKPPFPAAAAPPLRP